MNCELLPFTFSVVPVELEGRVEGDEKVIGLC